MGRCRPRASSPAGHQHRVGAVLSWHRTPPRDGVLDAEVVLRVRIEAAREHRLEHGRVAAFGVPMQHEVVLGAELGAQRRAGRRASPRRRRDRRARRRRRSARAARARPVAPCASEPRRRCRDCRAARPACAACSRRRGVATDRRRAERAARPSARPIAAPRRGAAPRRRRPTRDSRSAPCSSSHRGPAGLVAHVHHVDQRRDAAGNPVDVDAEAVQQLERREVAAAAGDVRRDAVGRIRAGLEQDLRQRQVSDCADRAPTTRCAAARDASSSDTRRSDSRRARSSRRAIATRPSTRAGALACMHV